MKKIAFAVAAACASLGFSASALAQEKTVSIAAFGVKSGVLRLFGLNSEAAVSAAVEEVNKAGGVKLADG